MLLWRRQPVFKSFSSFRITSIVTLVMTLSLLSNVLAQCPTPANDGNLFNTGSGQNPATSLGPAVSIGTFYPGYTTRMLVYMNTVNQFEIPEGLSSIPTANSVYDGQGQQLVVNFNQVSSGSQAVTNLEPSTSYYFAMVKYVDCGDGTYTINDTLVAAQTNSDATSAGLSENINAKDVVFGTVGATNIPLNAFTGITQPTTPTGYVIKVNSTNSFTPIADGTSAGSLSANTLWQNAGDQIVYVGSSSTPNIDITGLSADTEYYFKIYGYHGNYYQQVGHTVIASTITAKTAASITLTGSTENNITATVGDADISFTATSNSTSPLIYQIIEAPYYTTLSGSTLTLGKSGTVKIEVIAPGDATYESSKETITITVSKATPSLTFDAFTASANTNTVIPFTTNSDGERTFSIVGASNGNSLTGDYNNIVVPGAGGSETLLRVSVAESDYFEADSLEAYVTAIADGFFFTDTKNLYALNNGTANSIVDFTANATATGSEANNVLLVNDKVWGVTFSGGANGDGVVYHVDPDGSNFTKVSDFSSPGSTASPGSIQEINGKVYGVNQNGGISGAGEIWSANTDGTGYAAIHTFDASGLISPSGQLVAYNGKLYGSTTIDAANFRGGIFSMDYDGSNYTVEYLCTTFHPNPQYGLTLWNNLLWFPTSSNVYGWNPVSKTVTNSLTSDGSTVYEPIVVNNELYLSSDKHIEKSTDGSTVSIVYTFNTTDDIASGQGQLTFDGTRLWGTAASSNIAVVYSILPDGTDAKQEWKGTTANDFPSNNIIQYAETYAPTLIFSDQTVEHLSVNTLTAMTSSSGAISYEIIGGALGSSLVGDQLTAGQVGTITVRATVAAAATFDSASTDATFTIIATDPTATFDDFTVDFDGADVTLAPTSTTYTGGTITYAFVNGGGTSPTGPNTGSSISGDQLTIGTPGTETIRATIPSNSNFNSATFDFQLTINTATADLSGLTGIAIELFQGTDTISISSAPGVAVSYSLLTNNTGSFLSGTNNIVINVGNTLGVDTIRATVIEPNYGAATKDITLTLTKANPVITWSTPADVEFSIEPLDSTRLNASANVPGSFTYWIGQAETGTEITPDTTVLPAIGTYQLTAQFFPDDVTNYQEVTYSVNINATKIDLVIEANSDTIFVTESEPALSYSITSGAVASGQSLYLPLTREPGSSAGAYAITIDSAMQSTRDDGESAILICPFGLCVYGESGLGGTFETKFTNYNITFVPGALVITDKIVVSSADITLNPPASLEFDSSARSFSATPDAALSPALPAGDIRVFYEGRNGTSYDSSATAPINGGDYTVTAFVDTSNAYYTGSVSQNFTIAPTSTAIELNLPGTNPEYSGGGARY